MVGLGNPGSEYAGSRHNVGADTVELLAERHGGRLRSERGLHAVACTVEIAGRRVMLAIPTTYMNDSGMAVAPLVRRAGLVGDAAGGPRSATGGSPGAGTSVVTGLLVVHDELDLPPGRVKLKSGGGNAGHNGLKSIERHLGENGYGRVRIGIGKPPGRQSGADFVLRRPGAADRQVLIEASGAAADAVEAAVADGIAGAMNRLNTAG